MTITKFNLYSKNITLNHHNDHIGSVISKSKTFYEQSMLNYIYNNIPKGGTYIDVGANIGNHSIFFSKFCATRVIAIEPIEKNINFLKKNIKENSIENCVVIPSGISIDGRNFISVEFPNNMGSCMLKEDINGIATITVNELELSEITLLKIDCENMSLEVLQSFIPVITKYKPHIFIEATNSELTQILKMINYEKVRQFNATPTFYLKPL